MSLHHLAFEALSALTGHDIKPVKKSKDKKRGKPANLQSHTEEIHHLLFSLLDDGLEGSTDVSGGQNASICKKQFIHEEELFDPKYDYDFTNKRPKADEELRRGNEPYKRPYGWYRIALKVLNKYKDDEQTGKWLETGPDAWPVSYHGTSFEGAKGITGSFFKSGSGQRYGRGIYSTPNIETASSYCKTFTTAGKTYRVVLQNRINPKKRQFTERLDYWLVPVPEEIPPADEKIIVENAIRPYGLLLKEVQDEDSALGLL